MDPNSKGIPKDDFQQMGIDERILWIHKHYEEGLVEKQSRIKWEEDFLHLHITNPRVPVDLPVELEHLTELDEKTKKQISTQIREEQNIFALCAMSQKTWGTILSDLKKLRNLTRDKVLSNRELDLLEKGCFMLYNVKVPFFTSPITGSMTVKCTLCFMKHANTISMCILLEEEVIKVTFGEKNWICRNGKRVSFHLGDDLIVNIADFNTVEEAMEFEYYFMFVAEFTVDSSVTRLHGELAAKQLIIKGFTGNRKAVIYAKNNNHPFVEYLTATSKTHGPCSTKLYKNSFDEQMENLRRRLSEYMNNAYNLNGFLFKSCISFDMVKVSKPYTVLAELSLDFSTLTRILPFCVMADAPSSDSINKLQSFGKMDEDLFSLIDNVDCCIMLCRVLSTYFQYRQHFVQIINTVRYNVLFPENVRNGSNTENSNNGFNLAAEMHNYFKLCHDDPTFTILFLNLDKLLRVGNSSIFDVLYKKFKTELFECLSFSKTFQGVNKNFFGDRHSNSEVKILFRDNHENSVHLSELHEHFKNLTVTDTYTLSAGEDFVCRIVGECITLLRKLSHSVEKDLLKFDWNEWLTLVEIWRVMDLESSDSLAEQKQDVNLNDPKSRKSLPLPKDWNYYHYYEKSEFERLGSLGEGFYGSAVILTHKNLGKIVLKEYHIRTTHSEIKREIDMLIRLQGNPHIVKLFGFYCFDKEDFGSIPKGILLEYIERNLYSFIHDQTVNSFKYRYGYETAIKQMRGMASAFAAMHNQGIMHRDIKPDNILLTYADKIKVCDLGVCGSIDNEREKTNNGFGTNSYKSPEILTGLTDYNEKTDVFSLAVTMWEQVHRKKPKLEMQKKPTTQIVDFVISGKRMKFCDGCPTALKEIIQRAWAQDPADRPSMEELETALVEILSSLPKEILEQDVLGLFENHHPNAYYVEREKFKRNTRANPRVQFPDSIEDLQTFVGDRDM